MARMATISFTETRHFRRLVEFLIDAETYARETDDYALLALIDEARDDLLGMRPDE